MSPKSRESSTNAHKTDCDHAFFRPRQHIHAQGKAHCWCGNTGRLSDAQKMILDGQAWSNITSRQRTQDQSSSPCIGCFMLHQEVENQLGKMLKAGQLCRQVIFRAIKAAGSLRRVNEVNRTDVEQIPRTDDTLKALVNANWFSTPDFASGESRHGEGRLRGNSVPDDNGNENWELVSRRRKCKKDIKICLKPQTQTNLQIKDTFDKLMQRGSILTVE
ncbi:hypothetical protein T10_1907 [Trichinella papuae]|uniref:Uncharacterized protein n=1 Tax=Trichinella papuae TaxID=268474 RepID=A0A0V1MH90_9BILA|nr:hypothetical protein T10_1907 [Trichinella papuae]